MPMLSYPHFRQFLQRHQNQCEHYVPLHERQEVDMSDSSGDTSVSNSSTLSPSNSPPLRATAEKLRPGKSFTIDAILGLNDAVQRSRCTELTFHSAFHSNLTMAVPAAAFTPHPAFKDKCTNEGNKKCNGKSKRVRTIFTPEQLERLEAEFERQQYMVGPERLYLAHTLQLSEAQVKVWFQNRRIKWRKQHLEIQQQRFTVLKERDIHTRTDGDEFSGDSEDSCPTPVASTSASSLSSHHHHHQQQQQQQQQHEATTPSLSHVIANSHVPTPLDHCIFLDHHK